MLYNMIYCTFSDVDECRNNENDCVEHASCYNDMGGWHCECNAGYSGIGNVMCTLLEKTTQRKLQAYYVYKLFGCCLCIHRNYIHLFAPTRKTSPVC